jgi:hypothetical protein
MTDWPAYKTTWAATNGQSEGSELLQSTLERVEQV